MNPPTSLQTITNSHTDGNLLYFLIFCTGAFYYVAPSTIRHKLN